jgi:hypothetical protein
VERFVYTKVQSELMALYITKYTSDNDAFLNIQGKLRERTSV